MLTDCGSLNSCHLLVHLSPNYLTCGGIIQLNLKPNHFFASSSYGLANEDSNFGGFMNLIGFSWVFPYISVDGAPCPFCTNQWRCTLLPSVGFSLLALC